MNSRTGSSRLKPPPDRARHQLSVISRGQARSSLFLGNDARIRSKDGGVPKPNLRPARGHKGSTPMPNIVKTIPVANDDDWPDAAELFNSHILGGPDHRSHPLSRPFRAEAARNSGRSFRSSAIPGVDVLSGGKRRRLQLRFRLCGIIRQISGPAEHEAFRSAMGLGWRPSSTELPLARAVGSV